MMQILLGESIDDKLLSAPLRFDEWKSFELPRHPGRNQKLAFSDNQIKFPKAGRLKEDEQKAIALHSFANHELLAIEMMAAALLIYPHESEESIRFKKGILQALKDEQKHLCLYRKRLNELGYDLGDFPLNDFFWRQMEKLKTPAAYLSVMALTFESANLDFAQYYSNIFRSHGDTRTADVLDIVLEDEISHVALGAHWMREWRNNKTLWEYYRASLPHPLTPARGRGIQFDESLHRRAISDEDFIVNLKNYDDDFSITKRSQK